MWAEDAGALVEIKKATKFGKLRSREYRDVGRAIMHEKEGKRERGVD